MYFQLRKVYLQDVLRVVMGFVIFTIAPVISEFLLGNTRVTMAILKKCLGTVS